MHDSAGETFALEAFSIAGVHVDPSALELSSPRGQSTIEPKVMALLVTLAQRPGELWRRGDLLEQIWPNGFGSDEGLSRLVSLLRKAFNADHGVEGVVKTVPKLGYRLDATVEFPDAKSHGRSVAPALSPKAGPQAERKRGGLRLLLVAALIFGLAGAVLFAMTRPSPQEAGAEAGSDEAQLSLAVLPIENMGTVDNRPFLAEGMTRDLTASLSRVPNARVAPYSSTRLLTGADLQATVAARELDVRYIVTGAMSAQGDQLVLRIDLIDAANNRQIWSKRFTQPLGNFFAVQEQVVQEISTSIFSEIQASEIAGVRGRDDFDLSVYELLQKAESERYVYGRDSALRITSYLRRALEIDPESYSARAALAVQLAQNVISGFSDDPERDGPLALQYLDEVRAISPRDPQVLTATAITHYYLNGDMQQARRLLEQSLQIDPNEPHGAVILGLIKCYSGQPEEGLTLIRNSELRAPRDPRFGIWGWFRSACDSVEGEIGEARAAANEAIDRNPNYPPFHYALAHYECLLGSNEAAQEAVREARRLDPQFGQDDYEHILTIAGYPGVPGKSREDVFRTMRICLAGGQT